ncbi:uncharacterized protein LAESUDRAFT_810841 [Laetiporus sulphureus 93-53]|uniref:GCFC-domain-containing protein n=1 Tax=Laetiporus sulphureus 93-53 TaxID=1314785 RepID=A0A165FMY9_9APHY|nr:uncharacterized protein LAESUDRAFT_810841 [Laetiporus sulphureus 93-53]KZT09212.1 hypothetical protein LAESUDRAFT_810841 [Laetiporus sulphureus 93-53]
MADAPVVFKRTKPKHTQRRVSTPTDLKSTGDAEAEDVEESPSTLAAKLKKKLKTRESRLSFGGEEEGDGEVFQVKKSNLSKKLTVGKHPAFPGHVVPSSIELPSTPRSTSTPTYDAAYLSELKASTPTARPSMSVDQNMSYDADVSLDADSLMQSSVSSVIDISTEAESETAILSGSSILAAKQKRERLRTLGANGPGEDYISLSVSKRSDFSQGPHPDSRLVREEDELGDAADEYAEYTSAQERIALGKKSRKVEARKRREEMNEMIVDAEEEDEETIEWEQEQLRRGGLRFEETTKAAKPTYKPAPIPPITPIPTLGAAVTRLTQSLTALTTSHAQHSVSMASLGQEQEQLEARGKEMRELIAKAEDKRSWFAAFREWVESVATFLDEKYPELEKLEDEHIYLLKERAEMIAQRRHAEDEDDLSLFLGSLPQTQPQQDELDELGRVAPRANPTIARRDRLNARDVRRIRRRASGRAQQQEDEGYSTDSSLPPSDAADYQTALSRLAREAKEMMADVKAEEFRDPSRGLGKWFGEWRARFSDSYTGAWGGLGTVGAWEFWARLEILGWSPLEVMYLDIHYEGYELNSVGLQDGKTLDSFSWYNSLYQYSRPRSRSVADEDEEPELGPDGDLVSAMISTAVIPRLCKLLEGGGFDPYSATELRKLTNLAEQVEASVEKDSLKFEMMLKSVFNVFQAAVTSTHSLITTYLALNKPRFDPEAIPARRRFLARRYKLLRNILQWRKYTGERFGIGQLAKTLIDNDMQPVAEGGWEVGGEDYMRKVAQIMPKDMISESLQARVRL